MRSFLMLLITWRIDTSIILQGPTLNEMDTNISLLAKVLLPIMALPWSIGCVIEDHDIEVAPGWKWRDRVQAT